MTTYRQQPEPIEWLKVIFAMVILVALLCCFKWM